MTTPDIWDLLARWEEAFQRGEEIPLEELCREAPELQPQLQHHVDALKRTSWLLKPAEESNGGAEELPPATILGEYTILERLASGGMGVVYKALHRRMDRLVAVKLLGTVESPESLERFQREVRAVAKLTHPNIVTAHDAGEIGGCPYLVMELIEGCDLARHVEVHGPLPVAQAVDVIVQVARGLECAHSKGIIHGDVKPSNLILSADGVVKILDLGLARLQAGSANDRLAGTVDFLAPEATHEGAILDHRADIYSLGCTLWFLLTNKPLFERRSVLEKLVAHQDAPPPSLRQIRPEVPAALDAIYQRMVAKKPEDRYSSAQELADALTATVSRRNNKGFLRVALAVSLALILSVFCVAVWFQWPQPPEQGAINREGAEVPTVSALRTFEGHTRPVQTVTFSPDGKTIASGSADATVRLWPADGGRPVVLSQVTGCTALAFTEGGKTLGCGCENGTVRLWDLHGEEPKEGLVMPGHAGPITCVAFSPDGKVLATGGKDGTVRLLDRSAAKPQGAMIPKAGGVVLSLRFSGSGDKLLIGYGDEGEKPAEFWVWGLRQPEGKSQLALLQRAPLVGLRDVRSLLISPDGNLILASASSQVFVWERVDGKDAFRVAGSFVGPTPGVALSPDGRWAFSCGEGGLCSWEVASARVQARYPGHADAVNCVAVSPNGETAVSGGADGTLQLWPTPQQKVEEVRRFTLQQTHIVGVDISPSGDRVLTGSLDCLVRLWDVPSGQEIRRFDRQEMWVRCVAFSPDGRLALAGWGGGRTDQSSLRLWDVETGVEVKNFQGHTMPVVCVAFSPTGQQILSGSDDETMRLWDVKTGKELQCFQGHTRHIRSLAFNPHLREAISAGYDAVIRIWDLDSGKEIRRITGHPPYIHGVAYAPNGCRIVTGGTDGIVRLWNEQTGKEVRQFLGHKDEVMSVAYSPNGERILSGSLDGTVRLWDVTNGQELHQFQGHTSGVTSVRFSADGRRAVSGSQDGTARLWRLP